MQGNRRSDTGPERRLRAALHGRGLRFREQYPVTTASGVIRVDVAFPTLRLAVLVDGCFWHCCPIHGTTPKSHASYWAQKLQRNSARDRANQIALADAGWEVLRIWEHVETDSAAQMVEEACRRRGRDRPASRK